MTIYPSAWPKNPYRGGASKGAKTPREIQDSLLDQYYEAYGYGQRGVPTRERLHKLKLSEVAEDMESVGLNPQ